MFDNKPALAPRCWLRRDLMIIAEQRAGGGVTRDFSVRQARDGPSRWASPSTRVYGVIGNFEPARADGDLGQMKGRRI